MIADKHQCQQTYWLSHSNNIRSTSARSAFFCPFARKWTSPNQILFQCMQNYMVQLKNSKLAARVSTLLTAIVHLPEQQNEWWTRTDKSTRRKIDEKMSKRMLQKLKVKINAKGRHQKAETRFLQNEEKSRKKTVATKWIKAEKDE